MLIDDICLGKLWRDESSATLRQSSSYHTLWYFYNYHTIWVRNYYILRRTVWLLSSSPTSSCLSTCTTQNQLLQLRRGKLQGNPKPQQEATFLWFNLLSLFWDGTHQHTKHSFNSMKICLYCLHYRSWDHLSSGWLSLCPGSNSMEYYFSAPCTFS